MCALTSCVYCFLKPFNKCFFGSALVIYALGCNKCEIIISIHSDVCYMSVSLTW